MKKIDLKKPRYALPLVCFPFLLLFFYVYKSSFGKEEKQVQGKDSLQTQVAGVSGQVRSESLTGKLDAFRNRFKQADGYTAIGGVLEEEKPTEELGSVYNEREKRMLDSVDRVMKKRYPPVAGGSHSGGNSSLGASRSEQDRALAMALSKIRQTGTVRNQPASVQEQPDPMALFRAQMALVDSIGKANDPELREMREREKRELALQREAAGRKKVPVSRISAGSEEFNTVVSEENQRPISAVIDQDITGFSGSRLRIRLLDDIMAGRLLIRKGTYLYAIISGFSAQRVQLSISSVFQGGNVVPVNLQVYDNDGLPGIYVPSSAFREFTRELGGSGSQGITLQQQAETNNQLVMGILSKMFQSTTTAVNKLIRQNKAKIKYNTQVFLIDPDELKRKQQSY